MHKETTTVQKNEANVFIFDWAMAEKQVKWWRYFFETQMKRDFLHFLLSNFKTNFIFWNYEIKLDKVGIS